MKEIEPKTNTDNNRTAEDIFKNIFESNNSRFDIPGNMTTWRTHETYNGTGNHHSLWDELRREKRLEEKALKLLKKNLNKSSTEK